MRSWRSASTIEKRSSRNFPPTQRGSSRYDGTFSALSKEECSHALPGDHRLSTDKADNPQAAGAKADPVRRGIAAHLVDLRGFARYLTRDASAADDLVQDTVLRALAARDSFIAGTNLKAWLFTILRNVFFEQRRRKVKETEILGEISRGSEGGFDERDRYKDGVMDLSQLLWRLPELLREALILVGAQEMSYEEAAAICDCPVGTMKARVSRARAQLAEIASPSEDPA